MNLFWLKDFLDIVNTPFLNSFIPDPQDSSLMYLAPGYIATNLHVEYSYK